MEIVVFVDNEENGTYPINSSKLEKIESLKHNYYVPKEIISIVYEKDDPNVEIKYYLDKFIKESNEEYKLYLHSE